MIKKEIFLHKLDLLTLSLEILTSWHENKDVTQQFYVLHYKIKNQEYTKKHSFVFLIQYINKMLLIADKYELDKLASKVIIDGEKSLQQYTSKFLYTYYNNKKYYLNNKCISYKRRNKTRIATSDDAILQLYIISKLNKIHGIYKIIKYLK